GWISLGWISLGWISLGWISLGWISLDRLSLDRLSGILCDLHAVRAHGRHAPLDRLLAELLALGRRPQREARRLAEHEAARGAGEILEPLREVDGVADEGVLESFLRPEQRGR